MPKHITINHSTGSENYDYSEEEEGFSGVQVSSGSQEEFTESDEYEEDWDLIDDVGPSDSASRPRGKHHGIPPPAVAAPHPPATRRKPTRRAPPVHDPPSRSRSRQTLDRESRPRRRRPQSAHSEELEGHDDYPGYGPRPGLLPHHPTSQWGHIPQAPPSGYAPSIMSDPRYNPFQGAAPGQLVPFGSPDPYAYNHQNPFAAGAPGQNPFASPAAGGGPNGFFDGHAGHGHGHGAHAHRSGRNHRNSMPQAPPAGEMMPYGYPQGYFPPYGMPPYGMPLQGHYPPYGGHDTSPPPPHHSRSKHGTPAPPQEQVPAAPPPPPPSASAPLPVAYSLPMPPPPDTAKEDGMLTKLEQLLLQKQEMEEKKAEDAKFSRLEQLLIDQQQARQEKEEAKKKAAHEAAIAAAEAKKRGDEDKLAKLEKLILAQKDEQLKREAALAAQRAAEKAEHDAKVAKEAAEKKAQAEAAAQLLEAAKKAREEAEAKAAKEAEETKAAHEKALAEAKAAAEELEKAKKAAEEEAAKLKPSDAPPPPIKFKDAVGRKFSFPWHLCKTWKGMEDLIKQAFLHVDVIGPHVHDGHYDLVGPDGEIILPQVWETMVQPDWSITMHMWPMPEPPPTPKVEEMPQQVPEVYGPPQGKSKNKGKTKKRESRDMHAVAPGPLPPPPPPFVPGAAAPPSVEVMNVTPIVPKPRSKPAPSAFMRWMAAGNTTRSQSVKKVKKHAA